MPDYYAVLGVARTASQEEIQRAYRALARRYHPDVNGESGTEGRFTEVTEAYEVLSDPGRRARYDRLGPRGARPDEAAGGGPADPSGSGRTGRRGAYVYAGPVRGQGFGAAGVRGAGSGRAGLGDVAFGRTGLGGGDLGDLFGEFFPGTGRRSGRGRAQGADSSADLLVSVEDACTGRRRRLTVNTASGRRSFEVTIPPGVVDGQRIRVPGQGGAGRGGAPPGDMYLVVRLAPHPLFRVTGRDITVRVPVAPWEAALGASVPVPTPTGTTLVDLPAGTSSGRRLRLHGRGLPDLRGGAGDLYAEIRIVVPDEPSPGEQELYRRLAAESSFDPRARYSAGRDG